MAHPIGHIPWNKGLKTGLVPRSAFKKGHTPATKGKKNLKIADEKHWAWKGAKVKYRALHQWISHKQG